MNRIHSREEKRLTLGFALCGAFPALGRAVDQLELLRSQGNVIIPFMSAAAYGTDTRYGRAEGFINRTEAACGKKILHTVPEACASMEESRMDALVICPCTGNTLAKISLGIADSAVTAAACFAQRKGIPVITAPFTGTAPAGGRFLERQLSQGGIFLVPYVPDPDHGGAWEADFSMLGGTVAAALEGIRLQPVVPG